MKGRQVWGGKAMFQAYLETLSKADPEAIIGQAKIETQTFEGESEVNVNVKVFTARGLLAALRDVDAARAAAQTEPAQTETAPQAETARTEPARNGRSRSRV